MQESAQCPTNLIDMHGANSIIKLTLKGAEISFQREYLDPNILKTVTVGFSHLHHTRLHLIPIRIFTCAQSSIHQYWQHS